VGRTGSFGGEEVTVKVYWITAGVGALVMLLGGVVYTVSDHHNGLIIAVTGLCVGIVALVMRLVMSFLDDKGNLK
jgi:hypothetical protein